MSATITFDQMERKADTTLAWALWARHVRGLIACIPFFAMLHIALRGLLRSVTGEARLNILSAAQAQELANRLRELHSQLAFVLDLREMDTLRAKPIFTKLIESLEEDTEDLYDVIENLAFSSNHEFRNLVADCVKHVTSVDRPQPLARV